MNKVEELEAAGVPFAVAVRVLLGGSVARWALRTGVAPNVVSSLLNGSTPYPYRAARHALADTLGVERAWLSARLDEQRAAVERAAQEPAPEPAREPAA